MMLVLSGVSELLTMREDESLQLGGNSEWSGSAHQIGERDASMSSPERP